MHSICHTGHIFGSKRCDCGFQLEQLMQNIADHGTGALFYLANHEGVGLVIQQGDGLCAPGERL